jgi:hypothetical protein
MLQPVVSLLKNKLTIMKTKSFPLLFALLFTAYSAFSQSAKIDSAGFFSDDAVIKMTLSTDIRTLIAQKMKMKEQPGSVTMTMPDGSVFTGNVQVRARGKTKKETCNMPPLMLVFKNPASPLHPLEKLKLVCGCGTSADEERLVLKEYLVYKIFNFITEKSFRVRLVHITYEDNKGKRKPFTQYGFFIEDVDAMAKRNGCKELNNVAIKTPNANREQMALVDIFQYMIANTDWSVPNNHNIKLIQQRKAPDTAPYVVPYDFDYCGLVNAYYAVPAEILNIEKVTQRLYRGYPRSMEELQAAIAVYINQKENIYKMINGFEPLSEKYKKEVIAFLDDFYKIISDNKRVQTEFIDKARSN